MVNIFQLWMFVYVLQGAGVVFLTNLNIFTKPCRRYLVAEMHRFTSRTGMVSLIYISVYIYIIYIYIGDFYLIYYSVCVLAASPAVLPPGVYPGFTISPRTTAGEASVFAARPGRICNWFVPGTAETAGGVGALPPRHTLFRREMKFQSISKD